MTTVYQYVKEALESFDADPPDTDFQRGYLAALKVIWHEALKQRPWDQEQFTSVY